MFINDNCWVPGLFRTEKFLVRISIISQSDTILTFVPMRLQRRHFHSQDLFRLGRQFLDHILLQSPQHQRPELVVQILDLGLVCIIQVEIVCELDYHQYHST